jgi:hypothetical protein
MAEQLAALAEASIALRKQLRMLLILTVLALLTGITALALALA